MKKRIISFLLALFMLSSFSVSVLADEGEEINPSYYEQSTKIYHFDGDVEKLTVEFMIPDDRSGVYVRADDVVMFTGELGYRYELAYPECAIASSTLGHSVRFKYNSNEAEVYFMGQTLVYEAPLPTLFIGQIAWIPFDFASLLLNFNYSYISEALCIKSSELSPMMSLSAFYTNRKNFEFGWISEVGYSEEAVLKMSASAHTVNFLNGLLDFELSSWGTLLTTIVGSSLPYDMKYAEEISHLFVAPSQKALEHKATQAENSLNFLSSSVGFLGGATDGVNSVTSALLKVELNVDDFLEIHKQLCELHPAFENDKQITNAIENLKKLPGSSIYDFFNKTTDHIKVNKNLDLNLFEVYSHFIGICSYFYEFSNASERAISALNQYADNSEYDERLAFKVTSYGLGSPWSSEMHLYIAQNFDDIISDSLPMDAVLGGPAAVALVAWSIVSNHMPFFKNGLESTARFAESQYAICYQDESYVLYNKARSDCLLGGFKENKFEAMLNSAYTYMKFSFIAREAAVAVLSNANLDNSTKNSINKKLNSTNKQLVQYLCAMESEELGFLPSESKSYSKAWSKGKNDSLFMDYLEKHAKVTKAPKIEKQPLYDLSTLPEGSITAEEAVELAKKAVTRDMGDFFTDMLEEYNTFKAVGIYYVEDYGLPAHVVSVNNDEQLLFVPADGECVWMGLKDGKDYWVYTNFDLLTPSIKDFFSLLSDATSEFKKALDEAKEEYSRSQAQ